MPRLLTSPPRWLAPCVAAALAGQLVVAAVVVARPQLMPLGLAAPPGAGFVPVPDRVVPAAPTGASGGAPGQVRSDEPGAVRGPVVLAAPLLWSGEVAAEPLPVGADGALAVPDSAGRLGWWADGPRPGEAGAAVVVGHVDLDGKPGIFGGLAGVAPGTAVSVRSGEQFATYRVTSVRRYAKSAFPTDVVYAPTTASVLRLVTCGGRFDRRTGHYEDNVVVEAVLEEPSR